MSRLLRQRDQIPLHSRRFFFHLQIRAGLVNVRAHSQEHAPRRNGRKIAVLKSVIGLDQMAHAIGFGPESAAAKDINVDFFGGGLKPADEMAGQANAGNWKAQAARQKQVNRAEADGISRAAVHHAIDVAVFRMIAVMLVALETEFRRILERSLRRRE